MFQLIFKYGIIPLAVGIVMGALYFYLMWRNVTAVPAACRPRLLMALGSLGRVLLAVGTFLLIVRLSTPVAVVPALLGFIAARLTAVRVVKRGIAGMSGGPAV